MVVRTTFATKDTASSGCKTMYRNSSSKTPRPEKRFRPHATSCMPGTTTRPTRGRPASRKSPALSVIHLPARGRPCLCRPARIENRHGCSVDRHGCNAATAARAAVAALLERQHGRDQNGPAWCRTRGPSGGGEAANRRDRKSGGEGKRGD